MYQLKPLKPVVVAYTLKRVIALRVLAMFSRKQFCRLRASAVVILVILGLAAICSIAATPSTVYASIPGTLNFQARLETSAGAVVPDGNYNVTFHLYNATSSSGSTDTSCNTDANCLWEESYTYNSGPGGSDARIRVANGYLTANLGSVNPLTGISWDQQLYLTMDIGGTTSSGTITWDGQMSPRLPLTSVPYAIQAQNAEALNDIQGSVTDVLQFASNTSVTNQTFDVADMGAAGTYDLLAAPSGGSYTGVGIELQSSTPGTAQTGNFNVSGTGLVGTLDATGSGSANTLTIGAGATYTGAINIDTSASVTTGTVTIGGANQTGNITIRAEGITQTITGSATAPGEVIKTTTNSTSAFQVQSSTAAAILDVDSTDGWVGIGINAPTSRLTVPWLSGDSSTTVTIGSSNTGNNQIAVEGDTGTNVGVKGTASGSNGIGVYGFSTSSTGIEGQSNSGDSGFFESLSGTNTSPTLVVQQNGSSSASLFQVQPSTGSALFSIASSGAVSLHNDTNSSNAFSIQNVASSRVLNIDTTTSNLITNPSFEAGTSGWAAKGSATLSQVTTPSYEGNASMSVATAAGVGAGATYAFSLASSTQYTFSVFARAAGSNFSTFEIGRSENGLTDTSCLTAQTVTTTAWSSYRCTFTTATVSGSPYLYVKQTDATARTWYIDGAELTTGSGIPLYRSGAASLEGSLLIGGGSTAAATQSDQVEILGTGDNSLTENELSVQSQLGTKLFRVNEAARGTYVTGGDSFLSLPAFQVNVVSSDPGAVAAVLQGTASQTGDLLELQDSSGNVLSRFDSSGNLDVAGNIDTQTAAATLSLGTGNANAVTIGSTAANHTTTIQGLALVKTVFANSASALLVEDSSGNKQLTVDTSNDKVIIGNGTGGATNPTLLVLSSASTEPGSATNGAMYYNSTSRSFRCGENGAWYSCMGGLSFDNTSKSTTVTGNGATQAFSLSDSLPANSCATAGELYNVYASGSYTASAAATMQVSLQENGSAVATSGNIATIVGTAGWQVSLQLICIATNEVSTGGSVTVGQGSNAANAFLLNTFPSSSNWTNAASSLNLAVNMPSTVTAVETQFIVQRVDAP